MFGSTSPHLHTSIHKVNISASAVTMRSWARGAEMLPRLPGKLDWLMPTIILPSFPNSIYGLRDGAARWLMMLRWLLGWAFHGCLMEWATSSFYHYMDITLDTTLHFYNHHQESHIIPPGSLHLKSYQWYWFQWQEKSWWNVWEIFMTHTPEVQDVIQWVHRGRGPGSIIQYFCSPLCFVKAEGSEFGHGPALPPPPSPHRRAHCKWSKQIYII